MQMTTRNTWVQIIWIELLNPQKRLRLNCLNDSVIIQWKVIITNNPINIRVENVDIRNSVCEKLLGVKFDHKLTFNSNTSDFRKKGSKKAYVLVGVTPYMNTSKRRIIMNVFLNSKLNYCPLVWIWEKDGSISFHNRDFQLLAIEMYKASKGLFSPIIIELFEKKNDHQYNLRYDSQFAIPSVNSVYHGSKSFSFLGPKIWDILPDRLKKIGSLWNYRNVRVDSAGYIFTMSVLSKITRIPSNRQRAKLE